MILAYFFKLLSSTISLLFLGKARALIDLTEEHGYIKYLGLQRKKIVSWFTYKHMATRIELW